MKLALLASVFSLFLFAVLVLGDESIFLFINRTLANTVLDTLFLNIFVPLFYLLVAVPITGLFSATYRKPAQISLTSAAVSYLFGSALKTVFERPRPFTVLDARIVGLWSDPTFSFPSTTTIAAFSLAIPFFAHTRRIGCFLLFLAFSVSFFVIYSGFHYPSDAVAGMFISLCTTYIIRKVFELEIIKFLLRVVPWSRWK
ncbi:MAG: phosphatase PAP2 family protein [Candidatus Micrarchaeota archaeon]|nr:phosphatase PAP2 family protein [Candidatus Micrarchaeota archaeon]